MIAVAELIEEALRFLYDRINYESVTPSANREFKLGRMLKLASLLGNPQDEIPIIHIAGTKGKGSTSQMVASVLDQAGYSVGIFSSPHLINVNERFTVDGQCCTDEELCQLINKIQPVVERMDGDAEFEGVTFFEITTAIALLHFQDKDVDICILEVGLGGRLDSTNICKPLIAAITNIGLDHTHLLGDTIEKIATEKAGIIKEGVPTVCGCTDPIAVSTINQIAMSVGSRLVQRGIDFDLQLDDLSDAASINVYGENELHWDNINLQLAGRHQLDNAATAAAICNQLSQMGWNISNQHITSGISTATVPGRIQILQQKPTIILDVAHNQDSIDALMEFIQREFPSARKHLLISISKDKQYDRICESVLPVFDSVTFTTYTSNPRGVNSLNLLKDVESRQDHHAFATELTRKQPVCIDPPETAFQYVTDHANDDDLICVTGSFFLVGEIMQLTQAINSQ